MEKENIEIMTLKKELKNLIENTFEELLKENNTKEWMNLKEGAAYAGVCYNTFLGFRNKGLRICEIEGIKRVSKTEIDNFMNSHSF